MENSYRKTDNSVSYFQHWFFIHCTATVQAVHQNPLRRSCFSQSCSQDRSSKTKTKTSTFKTKDQDRQCQDQDQAHDRQVAVHNKMQITYKLLNNMLSTTEDCNQMTMSTQKTVLHTDDVQPFVYRCALHFETRKLSYRKDDRAMRPM